MGRRRTHRFSGSATSPNLEWVGRCGPSTGIDPRPVCDADQPLGAAAGLGIHRCVRTVPRFVAWRRCLGDLQRRHSRSLTANLKLFGQLMVKLRAMHGQTSYQKAHSSSQTGLIQLLTAATTTLKLRSALAKTTKLVSDLVIVQI